LDLSPLELTPEARNRLTGVGSVFVHVGVLVVVDVPVMMMMVVVMMTVVMVA